MVTAAVIADLNAVTFSHGQQVVNVPVTWIVPHSGKCLVCCRHALIVSYVTLQSRVLCNVYESGKTVRNSFSHSQVILLLRCRHITFRSRLHCRLVNELTNIEDIPASRPLSQFYRFRVTSRLHTVPLCSVTAASCPLKEKKRRHTSRKDASCMTEAQAVSYMRSETHNQAGGWD